MITNFYNKITSILTTDTDMCYLVKESFELSSIKDLSGLKGHLKYDYSFEDRNRIYFCDLIDVVEFEDVSIEEN